MKIQLSDTTNTLTGENTIVVLADIENMGKSLIAQTICELEILKQQLLEEYEK